MKKFLKTFLITFLICCIMVGIFLLRNYLILNKIRKLQIDTLSKIEEFSNFVFEEISINEILSDNKKLYCKDGIYKEIDYVEDKITDIKYFNINEQNEVKKEDILSCVKEAFILTDTDVAKSDINEYEVQENN